MPNFEVDKLSPLFHLLWMGGECSPIAPTIDGSFDSKSPLEGISVKTSLMNSAENQDKAIQQSNDATNPHNVLMANQWGFDAS